MTCPPDVAAILLEIIRTGLLRIRQFGWSNDPQRCAVEADHIHNLPDVLSKYAVERLRYYWEIERPSFINSASGNATSFEPLWDRLGCIVLSEANQVLAP